MTSTNNHQLHVDADFTFYQSIILLNIISTIKNKCIKYIILSYSNYHNFIRIYNVIRNNLTVALLRSASRAKKDKVER